MLLYFYLCVGETPAWCTLCQRGEKLADMKTRNHPACFYTICLKGGQSNAETPPLLSTDSRLESCWTRRNKKMKNMKKPGERTFITIITDHFFTSHWHGSIFTIIRNFQLLCFTSALCSKSSLLTINVNFWGIWIILDPLVMIVLRSQTRLLVQLEGGHSNATYWSDQWSGGTTGWCWPMRC